MSSEEESVAWLRNEIEQDGVFAAACLARPIFGSDLDAIAERIARCEAELAILGEHGPYELGQETYCSACGDVPQVAYPCRTVGLLAGGYKHRAGFPAAFAALSDTG